MSEPDFLEQLKNSMDFGPQAKAEVQLGTARSLGLEQEKAGRDYDISQRLNVPIGVVSGANELTIRQLETQKRRTEAMQDNRIAEWIAQDAVHAAVSGTDAERLKQVLDRVDALNMYTDKRGLFTRGAATSALFVSGLVKEALTLSGRFAVQAVEAATRLVVSDQERMFNRMFPRFKADALRPAPILSDTAELLTRARKYLEDPVSGTAPLFYGKRRAAGIEGAVREAAYKPFGIEADAFSSGLLSAALPLGVAKYGFGAVVAVSGLQSGLGVFSQKVDEGASAEKAIASLALAAAITSATTAAFGRGVEGFAKWLGGKEPTKQALRNGILKAIGIDMAEEFGEESLDQLFQEVLINRRPFGEAVVLALQAGAVGAFAGGVFGGAHVYAARRTERMTSRMAGKAIVETAKAMGATETAASSPEMAAQFILAQVGKDTNSYITPSAIEEAAVDNPEIYDELAKAGVTREDIQNATAEGGTVEVNLGEAMSRMSAAVVEIVANNSSTTPDGVTPQEAEAWKPDQESELAKGEVEVESERRREFVSEFSRLAKDTEKALGLTPEDARASWTPLAASAWSLYVRGSVDTPADLLRRVAFERVHAQGPEAPAQQEPVGITIVGQQELGTPGGTIAERFEQKAKYYQGKARPPIQTDMPAFKAWFGDSKVVDEQGQPLVVYHGTDAEFDTFDDTAQESIYGAKGFHFAKDYENASFYGNRVLQVYLSTKNPVVFNELSEYFPETYGELNRLVVAIIDGTISSDERIDQRLVAAYDLARSRGTVDGIILEGTAWEPGVGNTDQYVVFSPEQVKSATANVGTFDPRNPNILFQQQAAPTVIGTWFSGTGTLEAALQGVTSAFAVEFDPEIMLQYNLAHGTDFSPRDIRAVSPQEVKAANPTLFHSSPVCKNFSKAKLLQGATEIDRASAQAVAGAIDVARPPVVTVENVPAYQDTALFRLITDALDRQGYTWDVVVHDAADYGAPQHRKRMLLRAVREGKLPPLPAKQAQGDWFVAVEDLIDAAPTESLPQWERGRINAMIERGRLDPKKPILTMGGSAGAGVAAAVNAGEPSTTLKATPNEVPRILMPDGTVKRVTPRMFARLMGMPDSFAIPETHRLAKTVLGNGIHGAVTKALIGPLLTPGRISEQTLFQQQAAPAQAVPVQTDTPAFKAWFGDSKVVDESGKPLVVYHGTAAKEDFDAFATTGSEMGAHFGTNTVASYMASRHGRARVIPAYLAMQHPLRLEDRGSFEAFDILNQLEDLEIITSEQTNAILGMPTPEATKATQAYIVAAGYDGIVYLNRREVLSAGETSIPEPRRAAALDLENREVSDATFREKVPEASDSWITFSPTQIKSAIANVGTFDPRNPNILFQQQAAPAGPSRAIGAVTINAADQSYLVSLFSGANLTTILHETGHIFLEEIRSIVRSGRANDQLVQDLDAISDFLGLKSAEDILTVEQHEKFANSFLAYLQEGRAPSAKLESAFTRFRRWITAVYTNVTGQFGVNLNPQVRGVFDRMLATDIEVEQFAVANELTSRSESSIDRIPGVGPATKARVNSLFKRIRDRMANELHKVRARKTAARRTVWRKDIREGMSREPVWRAWVNAKKGGGLNVVAYEGSPDVLDLVRDIRKQYPGIVAAQPKYALQARRGALAHEVALQSGFDSVEAMLASIAEQGGVTYDQEVEARLVAREQAEDVPSDAYLALLKTPEFLEAEEALGKYLHTAAAGNGTPRATMKAIRALARDRVMALTFGPEKGKQTANRPDRFVGAAMKSVRLERRALLRDDYQQALVHNRDVLFQMAMAESAQEMVDMRDKLAREVARLAKAKPGKIGGILYAYHYHAVQVAVRYGLMKDPRMAPPSKEFEKDLRSLMSQDTNDDGEQFDATGMISDFIFDPSDSRSYKTLTCSDFVDVRNAISALVKRGRYLAGYNFGRDNENFNEVVTQATELAETLKDKAQFFSTRTSLGKWVEQFSRDLKGSLAQMDFVWRVLDGMNGIRAKDINPDLPFTKHFLVASTLAADANQRIKAKMTALLQPHIEALNKEVVRLGKYPALPPGAPGVPESFKNIQGAKRWLAKDILGIAMNMGNSYNKNAVALGFGWVDAEGNPVLDNLYALTSIISDDAWLAIQGVWTSIGELKAPSFAVFEEMFGFPPTEVQADAFSVGELNLDGGYFPLRFDPTLSHRQGKLEEATSVRDLMGASFSSPAARKGSLLRRTGTGGKPVLLDPFLVLTQHVDFTTKFITHGKFVRDAARLHQAMRPIIQQKVGTAIEKEINGWLRSQVTREVEVLNVLERAVEAARPLTALYVLGGKLKGSFSQAEALGALMADFGAANYAKTLASLSLNPKLLVEAWTTMMSYSVQQKERIYGGADRELHDVMSGYKFESLGLKYVSSGAQIGKAVLLAPYIYPALGIEFVAWWGKYRQVLEETGDKDRAVLLADTLIASTQPVTKVKDLSRIQRSRKGIQRLVTLFMTPFIRRYNSNMFFWRAVYEGKASLMEGLSFSFLSFLLSPVISSVSLGLIYGQRDDETEEEYNKRLARDLAEETVLYQVQGIPLAREAVHYARSLAERVAGVDRPVRPFTPKSVVARPARLAQNALAGWLDIADAWSTDDREKLNEIMLNTIDLMSYATGIPAVRIYRDFQEGVSQYEEGGRDNPLLIFMPDPERRRRR